MRMKIAMRETELPPRDKLSIISWNDFEVDVEGAILGRNEGTVRFLFAPPPRTDFSSDTRRSYQNDYDMADY